MPTQAQITKVLTELYKYTPSTLLEMFELDFAPIEEYYNSITEPDPFPTNRRYRFHNSTNERAQDINLSGIDVVWQGITYEARPIEFSGLEITSAGQVPKPNLTIANLDRLLTEDIIEFAGMVNVKVLRKRTFVKFIDAVNFIGGTNPTADPNAYFPTDVFRIDRMSDMNAEKVTFELSPAWDVEGVQLPRRQVIANVCPWKYKSDPCNWVPVAGKYYNSNDYIVSTAGEDQCGKRLKSCKLRFGEKILPYGGFPSAGLYGEPL
jgi:lambda family phage minor tail protein L